MRKASPPRGQWRFRGGGAPTCANTCSERMGAHTHAHTQTQTHTIATLSHIYFQIPILHRLRFRFPPEWVDLCTHINNRLYTEAAGPRPQGAYARAFAMAAARCPAVGFSAVQLTRRPSAAIASSVVGPMAPNCGDVKEISGAATGGGGENVAPLSEAAAPRTACAPSPSRTSPPRG